MLFFISCSKQKEKECLSYEEAVAQGKIEHKTSSMIVNDSLRFTLDHVLDKNDEKFGFGYYCVGSLDLAQNDFNTVATTFLKGYNLEKVNQFIPHFEGIDLCKGGVPDIPKDVKGYMVYYCNDENYVLADYVNLATGDKETYQVSEAYGTVKVHYLFKSVTSKNLPGAISIKNKGFILQPSQVKFLKKEQDTLYHKVHNKPMK